MIPPHCGVMANDGEQDWENPNYSLRDWGFRVIETTQKAVWTSFSIAPNDATCLDGKDLHTKARAICPNDGIVRSCNVTCRSKILTFKIQKKVFRMFPTLPFSICKAKNNTEKCVMLLKYLKEGHCILFYLS